MPVRVDVYSPVPVPETATLVSLMVGVPVVL